MSTKYCTSSKTTSGSSLREVHVSYFRAGLGPAKIWNPMVSSGPLRNATSAPARM